MGNSYNVAYCKNFDLDIVNKNKDLNIMNDNFESICKEFKLLEEKVMYENCDIINVVTIFSKVEEYYKNMKKAYDKIEKINNYDIYICYIAYMTELIIKYFIFIVEEINKHKSISTDDIIQLKKLYTNLKQYNRYYVITKSILVRRKIIKLPKIYIKICNPPTVFKDRYNLPSINIDENILKNLDITKNILI